MEVRETKERSIRQISGEGLLLMSIVADDVMRMAIESELERRATPHLEGRLARRVAGNGEMGGVASPAA